LLGTAAKCRALLLSGMYVQGARPGTVMAAWLHKWGLNDRIPNPPNTTAYPNGLEHVQAYALDMAYVPPPRSDDTPKLWRKRIYWVMHTMAAAASSLRPLRIVTMHPNFNWSRIWQNLHGAWVPDAVRTTWYMALHDIPTTKERDNRIALSDSDRCNFCGQTDSLAHRIIECGDSADMWRWTRVRMAAILRINACYIPNDWPLRPQFHIWPRQRQGGCIMDVGILRLLSCTALRPAHPAGLC
jgi:hypothetical protein